MSTDQSSLDPQLIEQTKQQIRSLVGEIASLTKQQDLTPQEFYGEFLNRVVAALAAVGGAVWTVNDDRRLALQYQINLQETRLREDEEAQLQHSRLLYKAMAAPEGLLIPPHSGTADDEAAANPTDFLLLLGALRTDLEVVGVLEIFQRSEAGPTTQRGYMRFLAQMCDLAADFLKSHQLRHFSDRQALWTRLEGFAGAVHDSLDPRETAYTIVNEGRRLIECDRVSVAISYGRKCRIEAVSGQDVFDKRSNTVRLLGRLATAVVATGEPMWYSGDTHDMPPQVEDAVQEYVDESHSKNVAVLPLRRPDLTADEDPDEREEPEPPVGALVVEQIEDSRMPPAMRQRVEVVAQHSSVALANSLEHQRLFLMPLWRAIGKARWVLRARTLPKTIVITGLILAAVLAFVFVPVDFNLTSKGTLEPINRRAVFARAEGTVEQVHVRHGDAVEQGQLLLTLSSSEIQRELNAIAGQRATNSKKILQIRGELSNRQLTREEQDRLYGELAVVEQEQQTLDEQFALYQEKLKDLEVRSPIAGRMVTWDIRRKLHRRPVQRGQKLLEVADPTKDWEIKLQMSEDRMGYITEATEQYRAERGKDERLPVQFILATDPATTYRGKVAEVALSAEVRGDEGNTVLIRVGIDEETMEQIRPHLQQGAEVTGKVYCGRRAVGFVWFHDLIAFIRSRIIFRFF